MILMLLVRIVLFALIVYLTVVIGVCLYPKMIRVKRTGSEFSEVVQVACGRCFECLSKNATEWAFRLMDEQTLHKDNCYVTLTYAPDHYPEGGNVNRRDVQLFIKRLRKKLGGKKIRYFYCGEYGKQRGRPHYHIIFFGFCPGDLRLLYSKDGIDYYRSAYFEDIWKDSKGVIGTVTVVKELNLNDTKYCAKYLQKLSKQKNAQGTVEPFIGMSNRPGIGAGAFDDKCLVTDKIYHEGKSINVPRYYLKLAEKDGWNLEEFHNRREIIGITLNRDEYELQKRRKKVFEFLTKRY